MERLIELLWGTDVPRTADHSIQIYVSEPPARVRAAGGDRTLLVTRQPGYALDVDPDSVDVWRFEHLVKEGHAAARGRDEDEAARPFARRSACGAPAPVGPVQESPARCPAADRVTTDRVRRTRRRLQAERIPEALDLLTAATRRFPPRTSRGAADARPLPVRASCGSLRSFHTLRTQLTDEFEWIRRRASERCTTGSLRTTVAGKGSLAAPNVRVNWRARARGSAGPPRGGAGDRRAVSDFSLVPRKENVYGLTDRDRSLIVGAVRAGAGSHRLKKLQ